MRNSAQGTLKVYFQEESTPASSKLIWSKFDVQVDEWIGAELGIPQGSIGYIAIKYITSADVSSRVAIDDVQFGDCRPGEIRIFGALNKTSLCH